MRWNNFRMLLALFALTFTSRCQVLAADDLADPLVDAIVSLLSDEDRDMRAVGFEQVRDQVPGAAATRRFADLLGQLPADAQPGLIDALAARGDRAARPAVAGLAGSAQSSVREAVLRALGLLGEASDVPLLVRALSSDIAAETTAALQSLEQIRGEGVDLKIVDELAGSKDAKRQTALMQVIERRQSRAAVPALLDLAQSHNGDTRTRALWALGQLGGVEDAPRLVDILLKSAPGADRDAAEKALLLICQRIADPNHRADPLLAITEARTAEEKLILLPALGRVGGPAVLKAVERALASAESTERDAAVRALCNWPDASVVDRLWSVAQGSSLSAHRLAATRALARVAVLRDERSDAQRLDLLKRVMSLATRNEERRLVLDRAKAIRTMDSLRLAVSCLDQPELVPQACTTVVELAHYRELRDPNKAEFDKALDRVISLSQDASLIDRAKRYQAGETAEKPR